MRKNTPKDGIINRLHVIQYLKGGGTISPHNDPYDSTKIQIDAFLILMAKIIKVEDLLFLKIKMKKSVLNTI